MQLVMQPIETNEDTALSIFTPQVLPSNLAGVYAYSTTNMSTQIMLEELSQLVVTGNVTFTAHSYSWFTIEQFF
jgi:hypothetical protein